MTLDDWKTANPYDEEKDKECLYCGEPSEKDFCDRQCYKAYLND